MRTVLALVLIGLALRSWALAPPGLVEPAPETSAAESVASVPPLSSAEARQNKRYHLGADAGFPVFPLPGVALSAGYYFTPRTLIGAEITRSKLSLGFVNVNATTFGLHYKRFFGNSFYMKAGGDYRQVILGGPDVPLIDLPTSNVGEARSLALTGAFGNQWHWERMSFGVEWAGLMIPVDTIESRPAPGSFNVSEQADLDWVWERVARTWSVQFLRLQVGASF